MVTLLHREFTVGVPLQHAWEHLARVESWPDWAPHIKKLELRPAGKLGAESTGIIHLANGMKSAFCTAEFDPPCNWKWVGPFLWLAVAYDHRFDALDSTHTRLTWVVQAEGFGPGFLGGVFAKFYRNNLEKAIPLLIREMNSSQAGV